MKTLTKKVVAPFAVSMIALGVGQAVAYEAGDLVVRGGYASVNPDSDSDDVLGAGTKVEVESGAAAGISLTYMFSSNLGLEVLAATPFTHDIEGDGGLDGISIGETKHLPPTVSLQYNFPVENQLNLYAGLGVNFTTFFGEKEDDELKAALGTDDVDVKLKDSWGLAVSAGVDYQIDDKWGVNAGLYWIDIDTEAKVGVNGTEATRFDVNIDPIVYRLNVVYKL